MRLARQIFPFLLALLCGAIPCLLPAQDTIFLRGDTIRVGELEWDMEKDWHSRRDLLSDNAELYGEHVRILLKYHRNKMVSQMIFGYLDEDGGFVAHGPARYYYDNGILLGKRYFADGALHGPAIDLFKTGAVKLRSAYDHGKLHGPFNTYFESGIPEMEARYVHELPVGRHQAWYSNGSRKWVELYADGQRAGPDTSFYETGGIEAIAYYAMGKAHGTWTFLHRNGLPWTARVYEEGKLVRVDFVKSKEGRPLEPGTFLDGNGWLYIYSDEGLPIEKELYRDGLLRRVKPIKN